MRRWSKPTESTGINWPHGKFNHSGACLCACITCRGEERFILYSKCEVYIEEIMDSVYGAHSCACDAVKRGNHCGTKCCDKTGRELTISRRDKEPKNGGPDTKKSNWRRQYRKIKLSVWEKRRNINHKQTKLMFAVRNTQPNNINIHHVRGCVRVCVGARARCCWWRWQSEREFSATRGRDATVENSS